jgi:hypothetical protein
MNYFAFVLVAILTPLSVSAKGVDELEPRSPDEKSADAATEEKNVTPPSEAPAEDTATPAAVAASPVVEKSASSQAIADKLSLFVNAGWARIPKAKLGTFASSGQADIGMSWKYWTSGSHQMRVSLRYSPLHSENQIDGQSYVSVIEGYHLGHAYDWAFSSSFSWVNSLEFGYLLVYMNSRDRSAVSEKSENNELATSIMTGLDWKMMEKLSIGPRIYGSFGTFTILQVSAATSVLF